MTLAELFYDRQARRTLTHRFKSRRRPRRSIFVFEGVEPRLLMSGDPIVAALTAGIIDAVDDAVAAAEDTPVTIDVLANDSDPASLTISAFTDGAHGTVAIVAG